MTLCYNVLRENSNRIEFWNVFEHAKFNEAANNYLSGVISEKELQREACYYFWNKCEYEVVVCGWPNQEIEKKLDIYDQLIANWFVFINYLNSKAICSWGDGVSVLPDGVNELDPCIYTTVEAYRNVTIELVECENCGNTDIIWRKQDNTEEIDLEEYE